MKGISDMKGIREYVRKSKEEETIKEIQRITDELSAQGFNIEFGNIGQKTTYAMIYTPDHDTEYVGYTFVRNIKYYNENIGKLKALQQAIARKDTIKDE